jgi:hypothetical protein
MNVAALGSLFIENSAIKLLTRGAEDFAEWAAALAELRRATLYIDGDDEGRVFEARKSV